MPTEAIFRCGNLERKKHLETTLKGIGAALREGFGWNSPNTFLVDTAETRALAILEVSVHLDLNEDLPADRYFVEIDIPEDVQILELEIDDLPEKWDPKPTVLATQYIGDDFEKEKGAAVLKVPSCIVPPEYNYSINPSHPEGSKITLISKIPLTFDSRLKKLHRIWKNLKKVRLNCPICNGCNMMASRLKTTLNTEYRSLITLNVNNFRPVSIW